jgi:hypothetical protein
VNQETQIEYPRTAWVLIAAIAAVQFVAHVATNGHYGMFRDEFYYLACANHLDWGYVDQPPLSIAILAAWKAIAGDSVQAIRILPALAGASVVVLAGMLARELGGGRFAQGFSALAAAVAPAYIAIAGFYSMNAFEVVVWTAAFYLLARLFNTGRTRLWIPLGLLLGLGLLNKISVFVLGAGIAGGLLLTQWRAHLRSKHLWAGAAIALVLFAPYVVWQVPHGWPTLEFIANAKKYKIAAFTPPAFLAEQIQLMHPMLFPLWLAGLGYLFFSRSMARYRAFAWGFVIALVILVVQKSKPYYFVPAFPPLLAAGSVALERVTRRRLRWVKPTSAGLVAVTGLAIAPLVLPVLSPQTLVRYQAVIGLAPSSEENSEEGELPQIFADRFGWQEMTMVVASVYEGLPESDRERCVIYGGNYGEAGAISYYGRAYGLPRVVSGHNNYFLWGPGDVEPDVLIAIGVDRSGLEQIFEEVTEAAVVDTPYSRPGERGLTVYVVRRPKVSLVEGWAATKHFI